MKTDTIEYNVSRFLIAALINADVSGLDDEDAAALEDFELEVQFHAPAGFKFGHFAFDSSEDDQHENFRTCEVTNLLSDTATLTAVYVEVQA